MKHLNNNQNMPDEKTFTVKFVIPEYVQAVARILIKEGYKCYLVGGALRDIVLDIQPDDYDLATDADPDEMLKIFPKAISTGAKFGTVTVVMGEKDGSHHDVQVTTFRSEEQYVDGRWPSKVEFVDDLDVDLSRRDFTFNSMAFDFSSAELDGEENKKTWTVYDPYGGRNDLKSKIVRAVGNPVERFKEDGLRAFKACRMAAQLGFDIEPKTLGAIKETLSVARQVSMERIRDEFMKMLKNSDKPSIGVELMRNSGLLEIFLPELLECVDVEQLKFHAHDVYGHLLHSLDKAPVEIRLAALLHDIGKPRKNMGDGRFYGHDIEGEKMTREIMKRMKFSNAEIDRVASLVRYHMFYFPTVGDEASKQEVEEYEAKKWTDSAVRRFIFRVGEENLDDLFKLRIADAISNPKTAFTPKEIELLQERISEVRAKDMALSITDLVIDGNDLQKLGVEKGPRMGEILSKLLEIVIEDPGMNDKEKLENEVKGMLK
jgi:poly(A) polymerase/tRNA nucleotidyltransferase (CCA-adding enzyme)